MYFLARHPDPYIHIFANLKSGNIFVNLERGETKVTDFGQGSLKDLGRTMTSIGTVAWTGIDFSLFFSFLLSSFCVC